jgi:nucleotide-binding universal stress UspA family protein
VPAGLRADWTQEIHEQGRDWLRQAEEAATLTAPEVQVQAHLLSGDPRHCLLAEAESAQELVVGARGLGGFTQMVLGSTSAAVAQQAPCPVVMVHGPGTATGPVVVGLDGSAVSEQALGYAFETSSRAEVPVLAVHAWGDLGKGESWLVQVAGMTFEDIEAVGHQMLAEQLAGYSRVAPPSGVSAQAGLISPAHHRAGLVRPAHHAAHVSHSGVHHRSR